MMTISAIVGSTRQGRFPKVRLTGQSPLIFLLGY
jgi:hypothetical protein